MNVTVFMIIAVGIKNVFYCISLYFLIKETMKLFSQHCFLEDTDVQGGDIEKVCSVGTITVVIFKGRVSHTGVTPE